MKMDLAPETGIDEEKDFCAVTDIWKMVYLT